tara:strand:+ start:247 stop:1014 length:768 start_codon:yes stop_codon:yes gene_type:complete
MKIIRHAKKGHIASAFSIVEILVLLYDSILKVDPKRIEWPDRDRFILSKGHGCLALYAILGEKGFFSKEEWKRVGAPDGILGGHPTKEKVPGVEASTGSLGHGLSLAVGIALAAKMDDRKYKSYALLGDGECNEGSVWEAAMGAAKHNLDNLIVLIDYNKNQSYSTTYEVCDLEPFADKWTAFGFEVREADLKKNPLDLLAILNTIPIASGKPTAIICHTLKGMGVQFMENDLSWHYKSNISVNEINEVVKALTD